MKKTKLKKTIKISIVVLSVLLVIALLLPPILVFSGKYKVYREIDDIEPTRIGIVFGAGVKPSGKPYDMLEDRLLTALDLYNENKIDKILVTGDNRVENYNEPQVMFDYLADKGIPEDDIVRDYAGRRTYDSCFRAHEIFGVDEALLITQGYHLPRSIYLCNRLGVKSSGFSATRREYLYEKTYKVREIAAIYKSLLDLYILKPTPVLGEKEAI